MKKLFKRAGILFTALLTLSVGTTVNNKVEEVNAAATTVEMSSFSATSGNVGGDSNVTYTTAKGGGTSNPAINGTVIRLYQNSQGTGGGTITLTVADGYEFSSVTIGSSMKTSIAYTLDDETTKSSSSSLAANGKYTYDASTFTSITFHCMGTSSSSRLYVNYLSATYDVAGAGDVVDPNANPLEDLNTDASLSFDYEYIYGDIYAYTLVEDASELKAGDNVIIVASDYNYAMSTTQNTNNRGQAVVTKTDNYIGELPLEVQKFTLGVDEETGFYTFYTDEGYIYAAGTADKNNYLKTKTDSSDLDAQWTIAIADGRATIQAQGDAGRDIIRYNSTNQSGAIFSCYASGQEDVSIYKYDDSEGAPTVSGLTDEAYRNVKMTFGAKVAESNFATAPTEAGVIFTSASHSGSTSLRDTIEETELSLDEFVAANNNYVVKKVTSPANVDGNYAVGGSLQVIGENEFLSSDNVERFASVVTAAVYFVVDGEVVILKNKTYSVNDMISTYIQDSASLELTEEQVATVTRFQSYVNSL